MKQIEESIQWLFENDAKEMTESKILMDFYIHAYTENFAQK